MYQKAKLEAQQEGSEDSLHLRTLQSMIEEETQHLVMSTGSRLQVVIVVTKY